MNIHDVDALKHLLTAAGIETAVIEEVIYDVQFETTVSSLEARLRGGYEFEEIIADALGTTMDFYDADCAMVVSVDLQLQLAKCLYEAHREGFMPICGTQPMYLNEYPEIQQAMHRRVRLQSWMCFLCSLRSPSRTSVSKILGFAPLWLSRIVNATQA